MDTPTFDELRPNAEGLLPAIVQDDRTLRVLQHTYLDRAAYEQALAEGCLCLGGCTYGIVSLAAAADGAALLVRAIPQEGAGEGFASPASQAPDEGFIRYLQAVIQGRHREMPEGSYTTYLFNKGVNKIAQKVGEEAVETVIEAVAGNHERLIYEASDLIYHLLVLMEATGHSLADLETELVKRHK